MISNNTSKSISVVNIRHFYSFVYILYFIFSISACVSEKSNINQKMFKSLNTEYSSKPGDPTLFSEDNISIRAKKSKHKKKKKEKQWTKISFETEPMISMSQIRRLTTCPIPKLNLTKPTITTNVEWQIFVYCVLDILPKAEKHKYRKNSHKGQGKKHGKKGKNKHKDNDDDDNENENNDDSEFEGIEYPEISEMEKKQDAYKFLKKSLKKFLKKYLFHNPDLTLEQKFALFERIFLVTKFRVLTQDEKAMVEDLIQRKGLNYITIIYRQNWYFSQFYKDHFDYSQDPQPEYESWQIYGKITGKESGELIDNMKYRIPANSIYGFKTGGTSQTSTSILAKIKDMFSNQTTLNYNFDLQFYLQEGSVDQNTNGFELPVYVEQKGLYQMKVAMINLTSRFMYDVNIPLELIPPPPPDPDPGTPPEESKPTWPDIDTTPNQNIENLNWAIIPGALINDCSAPDIFTKNGVNIIDAYLWQDFIRCYLDINISQFYQNKDYLPLVSKSSAFNLMYVVIEEFKKSDYAILKSDAEMVASIFTALTFQEASANDLQLIELSVTEFGLDFTYTSLLEKWYQSPAYDYFNYSRYNFPAQSWYTISGGVLETGGTSISDLAMKLINPSGDVMKEGLTDLSGNYSFKVRISDSLIGSSYKLKISHPDYGEKEIIVLISTNRNIVQNIFLNPIGQVSPDIGGQVISSSKETIIDIPPGAVSSNVIFSISDLIIREQPDITDSEGAVFEINPSYTFTKPVRIKINIEALQLKYPEEKSWLVFSKKTGEDWQRIPNAIYNPTTKTIHAELTHFSIIGVFKNSDIKYSYHHPLAEVLDAKTMTYPDKVPEAKAYAKNLLDEGGWDSTIFNNITIPKAKMKEELAKSGVELIDGTGCNEQGTQCSKIIAKVTINEDIPVSGNVVNISGTLNAIGSADLDFQAEQCKINPLSSYPSVRLNGISGTNISFAGNLFIKNHEIPYICSRERYKSIRVPSSYTCHDWSCHWHYTTKWIFSGWDFYDCPRKINHNSYVRILLFNGSYRRSVNNGLDYEWLSSGYFDAGYPLSYINLFKDRNTSRYEDYYAIIAGPIIKKSITQYMDTMVKDLLNWAKNNNGSDAAAFNKGYIKDPEFDDTNCHLFAAPIVKLLNYQHYYITSWPTGYTSSNITWQSDLDGSYFIKANGQCDSTAPILESGTVSANTPVISSIDADKLSPDLNTVRICINKQYHDPGELAFSIIKDDNIANLTVESGINQFLSNSGYSEISINWLSDQKAYYSIKINDDCTSGSSSNSTGINRSGSVNPGVYTNSQIKASDLTPGLNDVRLCTRYYRTNALSERSFSFTLDETPPTTTASPNLEGGIFAEAQTVTINCTDNYGCSEIAYTTNGVDPDFISSGLVVPSDSVSISVGSDFDGLHTVKFVSRDKAGNIESNINTLTFSVHSTIPEVTAKVDYNFISASGGYPQSTIEWTTNVDGFYNVKYKGNCGTGEIIAGANTNGNVNLDVPILTVIDADELIQGTNTLYICVENLAGVEGSGAVAITLDNDAPTLTIEPSPRGDYNTPQIATIGCTEKDCEKIIYTMDNSEPTFDPNGDISNGMSYTASIALLDQAKTVIRYSAIDYAGNISPVQTASYTIDTITPEITIVSGRTSLSIGDGIESTELIWNTSRSGLEYSVQIGGIDCQSGQTSLDNGRSGTTTAGDISTTILAEELELGESAIRICVANLIGHYGSETHTITRVENPPSLTLHSIDRKFLSLKPGFDLSNISWESNQSGDFAFKFKGSCETGETLPGATNSGTINANEKMLSVINATDIKDEGMHAIFICVTNKNNMSSELVDIIFLDKTPPATGITPRGGVFAKAKKVTLECTDNNECDSIVYTLDGTMPEFYDTGSGNGTEVNGNKIIITIGSGSNGIYPLIFKSRDKVRNEESINSINFYIDNTVPDVTINSLDHRYISKNGYVSATISWQSDQDGSYSVKVSGDCTLGTESTGLNPSGAVQAGTPIESKILAGDLFPGQNTIRICVTSAGKTAEQTETITLDDTAPLIFANPGEGAYGTEQEVTISCSDNCLKIAYTEDGTTPQFDASGNITNGIEYVESWLTPTWQSTMLKYRAFDLAGNVSLIQSSNYVIDDRYPTVSLVLKQRDYVSINGTFNSSDLIWNVDFKDLDYAVKIGGTGCTDGALSSGSGGSGKTVPGNIVSSVLATDLVPNKYNKVRICARNLIPSDGEYDGYTTAWIKRHDEEPNLTVGEPQYSTVSSKGYDQTLLVWTSDLDGDYIIKINGDDCDSGTTSSGAGSVGQVYSGNSISTTIRESDLDPGVNTIRICVNGRNGLQKNAVFSITKDETGPTVIVLNEGSLKVHLSSNGRISSTLNWNSDSTGLYSIRKGGDCVTGDLAIAANSSGPLPTDLSPIDNTIYANDLSDFAPGVVTNILICVIKESNGTSSSKPVSFYRDDNAPQVVTWIPTGTEVKLDSQIMVDFDKELDPSTVTLTNIELSNPLAGIISGTYSYASNRIIFIPSGLDSNKDYIFTVYSGVTDLYGNHLSQHEWSFHTEISNLWRKAIWSKSIWTIP